MQRIIPHLWFADAAEAAATRYVDLVPGSRRGDVMRYSEAGRAQHGQEPGAVMVAEFKLGGYAMVALNAGPIFAPTPAVSDHVTLEREADVDRFWAGLIAGGEALMPLDAYDWSPKFGWLNDAWGVSWQVSLGDPGAGRADRDAVAALLRRELRPCGGGGRVLHLGVSEGGGREPEALRNRARLHVRQGDACDVPPLRRDLHGDGRRRRGATRSPRRTRT